MQNLIRPDQLAKALGVSRGAVYLWVRRGKIPYLQLEKCIRFDPDEIAAWIKAKRRNGDEGNVKEAKRPV